MTNRLLHYIMYTLDTIYTTEVNMKKFFAIIILFALLLSFASCECKHEWQEATCQTAKTCALCSITEGDPLEHTWEEATCIAPKTCTVCGITEGTISLEHNFAWDGECYDCGLIELSLNNFEDYIEYNVLVKCGEKFISRYTEAECYFEATGNSHYKFNNVWITIEFTHYGKEGIRNFYSGKAEAVPYSTKTKMVSLNVAGNGSVVCNVPTPYDEEEEGWDYQDPKMVFNRTFYKIVSVSGTIEEY